MTAEPAIEVAGLNKRYRLAERSLVSKLVPARRRQARDLWANRNVDLRIDRGETVGMLGRNGAGKSTLLRMLAGVSEPTTGSLIVRGRIAPLISVGVGFHKELTGRENVYVNGMLLGLTREEIDDRFDDIVAFAELGDRIDSPVKFYSSGMFMRLGFSVAIHVDPDVLLVDEVLAVGDYAFQVKCFDRMRALVAEGTTIVLVSHSVMAIQLLCPRTLVFSEGELVFDGATNEAIEEHHRILAASGEHERMAAADQQPTGGVAVDARLLDGDREIAAASQDAALTLRANLRFAEAVSGPHVIFRALTDTGEMVYQHRVDVRDGRCEFAPGDDATVEVSFRPAFGGGGTYRFTLTVTDSEGRRALGRSVPLSVFVPPRLGDSGTGDLRAAVTLDDTPIVPQGIALSRADATVSTADDR